MMHGIAIEGDTVYLATVTEVYRAEILEDGTLGPLERIIDDLPAGGQHPNRMIVVGPDGKLYISVGSTCNACAETDPESTRPSSRSNPMDRRARSSPRACAIRSATVSIRTPASSTAWTTASTGSATASKERS